MSNAYFLQKMGSSGVKRLMIIPGSVTFASLGNGNRGAIGADEYPLFETLVPNWFISHFTPE